MCLAFKLYWKYVSLPSCPRVVGRSAFDVVPNPGFFSLRMVCCAPLVIWSDYVS
jgi:hypothetical protein